MHWGGGGLFRLRQERKLGVTRVRASGWCSALCPSPKAVGEEG